MDPDSSMLSSPSSHGGDQDFTFTTTQDDDDQDQDLFPDSHQAHQISRPQTPQNNHLNAAAPGELSPPRSQSHNQHPTTMLQSDQDPLLIDNHENDEIDPSVIPKRKSKKSGGDKTSSTNNNNNNSSTNGGSGGGGEDTKWKPGSWKTKKAQDEMARAWENFVDKDFTCAAFPDPLAGRVDDAFLQQVQGGSGGGAAATG